MSMLKPVLKTRLETNIFVPTLSPEIQIMLDKAAEFMTNTKDLSHGIDHIYNLLKSANRFFKSTGDKFDIDKEVLLLSLYWHDVWKSQNIPTPANYLFHQLYEGLGSMFMFKKQARTAGLSPRINRAVSYAIRKHSLVQFRPAKTLEAQLLWDMDMLDFWNLQRVQAFFKNFTWANIFIFDSYVLYMRKVGLPLNFEWTKNEVKKRKAFFFEAMAQFRESLVNGNKTPEPGLVQSPTMYTNLYSLRSLQGLRDSDDKP
jgi:hypothetical protein